ncbi:TFIIB-type zinc ribbon-containing protein [Metabacillus litoralis]|jgi:DNA-directed RNA polymerase subunit RPC12/RpoP|uniref:TFIIB-type zinc ribbon-containing protein n=1 Tax=Metabacillus litoralis TaxID=152268 RepID=UPI0020406932|nr:TFIIB-type zinc ribbon-containing protein [Metabacillus litoralis]MCM3653305.1 TFIIB-type zinc ribbon-containing protein [Metabacillus litoralis]
MVIQYKCPNCGDDMAFDSESGKLSCHSCGRKDNIESFKDEFIVTTFSEDEAKEYICNNCGAVVITDADTTATSCSFCGAGVVLGDRLSGALAPAKVIPFTVSKEEAMDAFRKWCKNGRLTPRGFMTADRIKGITGIYVPFWMYDLESAAKINAVGTKVRTYTQGEYIYTETSYYDVYRDIKMNYVKVPVDASEKMNDEMMDKLEPYDYRSLKKFKTPYLAGYFAEKYNYNDDELLSRVKSKVNSYINSYISSTITGYASVQYKNQDIETKKKHSYYVLLPIWMIYYDYDKHEHTFAMNGQTGKVVGKPPISFGKVAAWFGGVASSTFIVLKLVSYLLGGGLW